MVLFPISPLLWQRMGLVIPVTLYSYTIIHVYSCIGSSGAGTRCCYRLWFIRRIHALPGKIHPHMYSQHQLIKLENAQRDLPARVKRKLHAIGGGRGVWSLPVRQTVKVNGSTYEKPINPHHAENDSVIISTDANPSPGLSRVRVTISTC